MPPVVQVEASQEAAMEFDADPAPVQPPAPTPAAVSMPPPTDVPTRGRSGAPGARRRPRLRCPLGLRDFRGVSLAQDAGPLKDASGRRRGRPRMSPSTASRPRGALAGAARARRLEAAFAVGASLAHGVALAAAPGHGASLPLPLGSAERSSPSPPPVSRRGHTCPGRLGSRAETSLVGSAQVQGRTGAALARRRFFGLTLALAGARRPWPNGPA